MCWIECVLCGVGLYWIMFFKSKWYCVRYGVVCLGVGFML